MFGFGNERLVREVSSGTFNLVSLLDIAGVGQPPRFWRDPYVLGYLFGTASMLLAIGSKFKSHGDKIGPLIEKIFREFSGPRGNQVTSDLSHLLLSRNGQFLDAARISSQIAAYVYGLKQDDLDARVYVAIAKGGERALALGSDLSERAIKQHVYDVFVEENWISVIRGCHDAWAGGPLSEKDRVAQESIHAAKAVGAKTPRDAAEITMGRPFSDAEWDKWREPWERNWPLVPPPPPSMFNDGEDD
ncbi:hypothetical protein [Pleomorphomonas sp. PLEO]|uniref:hypothetical protein n=1 Tax=Pleomorphomonas sp. PLEO TaxID=3239306 RepID=UPI00351E18E1